MRIRTLLTALLSLCFVLPTSISAQESEPSTHEMPVAAWYCEKDPGKDVPNPGGGRAEPWQTMLAPYDCIVAEGVALTFSADEGFGRCDTDEKGQCTVETPFGPDLELNVAVHMATVKPGYAPTRTDMTTVNYTEFAGFGIAFVRDTAGPGQPTDRTTLAFEVADNSGKPAEVLTQLSNAEITAVGADWLATNPEGWVSYDISELDANASVDLIIRSEGQPARVSCDNMATTVWIVGNEAAFTRITIPSTDENVTCRITLDR